MASSLSAEHRERLLVLGLQTAHLVHDWNNLLTLLQMQCAELPPSEAAAALTTSLKEATALPRILLGYLRQSAPVTERILLDEWLETTLPPLRKLIGPRHKISFHPRAPGAVIAVDPHQLRNSILNLLLNARVALDEDGQVHLETSVEEANVLLTVRDNGRGMEAEIQSRVLEPFFSSSMDHNRTGLGISSVKSFLEENWGTLQVESRRGSGTCFTLQLPLAR